MKKSDVFFADRRCGFKENIYKKINKLINKVNIAKIDKGDIVACKLHFGEYGNTSFLSPINLREIIDNIKKYTRKVFVTDANTIYQGSRSNAIEHIETAIKHGFTYSVINAPIIIADGIDGQNYSEIELGNTKYYKKVYIANEIVRASALVTISHFKGHELFGFGGAIKNLGMGCAVKRGKLQLHSNTKPYVVEKHCIGCGICQRWCRYKAITIENKKSKIDVDLCSGCGLCIMSCPQEAIKIKWNAEYKIIQEKTCEYALGALQGKKDKKWFFNFLINITPECDCYPFSDSNFIQDIGILCSTDPVAIDQASVDLTIQSQGIKNTKLKNNFLQGEDKIKSLYNKVEYKDLLNYAQKIGLGSREYNLIKV